MENWKNVRKVVSTGAVLHKPSAQRSETDAREILAPIMAHFVRQLKLVSPYWWSVNFHLSSCLPNQTIPASVMEGVWADEYEDDDFLDYYGEAVEVPEPEKRGKAKQLDPDDPKAPKPKRIVQNPRPKLDVDRLLDGEKGLIRLIDESRTILYEPGKEIENLRKTMTLLQHWSHRLFPKYTFKDFMDKCETLGKKRPLKTHLRKVRVGLIPT